MINQIDIEATLRQAYTVAEYPALTYQTQKWGAERPLEGLRILDATPVFRNTMAKHLALAAAGAEVVVGVSGVMPFDPAIKELLSKSGFQIVDAANVPHDLNVDIVLDCAAAFIDCPARLGYVELTGSGIERYRESGKRVYMADSGRIKRIETSLGTGESYFRAMAQLGYTEWSGRKVVLFGSGKVGRGILAYAVRNGAVVTLVTDPQTVSAKMAEQAEQVVDFRNRELVDRAIQGAYAVVTATGVVGAVARATDIEALINSDAILANMGVEDEFGAGVPAERVLEHKRPLNFILEEPTHMKYIDATMALHNAGALCLLTDKASGVIMPSEQTEQELLDVSRRNGVIGDEIDSI